VVPNQRLPALSCSADCTLPYLGEPIVFISLGCATASMFDSLPFSFGTSFLTGPLQAVPKSNSIRKVKTRACEKYFFIVQIGIEVFYLFVGLGVALQ
jgi:hypothetical protein